MTAEDEQLPDHDEVFGVLKCERRRLAIRVLDEADRPLPLGELAEAVAAREAGTTVGALSSAKRKNVYTALYQSHLSKLKETGAVEYIDGRDAIRAGPNAGVFLEYLRVRERPTTLVGWARSAVQSVMGGTA